MSTIYRTIVCRKTQQQVEGRDVQASTFAKHRPNGMALRRSRCSPPNTAAVHDMHWFGGLMGPEPAGILRRNRASSAHVDPRLAQDILGELNCIDIAHVQSSNQPSFSPTLWVAVLLTFANPIAYNSSRHALSKTFQASADPMAQQLEARSESFKPVSMSAGRAA
nr:hypothetical protein CFP56_22198 [Quercus suber]